MLYPSINGSETLSCNCPDHQCQRVYWYRLLQNRDTPEFLVSTNNLKIPYYPATINQNRFKTSVSESTRVSYTLRITGIQKKDAGFYSCLLSSQNSAQDPKDLIPQGYYVKPGGLVPSLSFPIFRTILRKLLICSMALNHNKTEATDIYSYS